jgi:hypothetical protein
MEDIHKKVKCYFDECFYHYKNNCGNSYKNITREDEYYRWFEKFLLKITCDYKDGYNITEKYSINEFFNDDVSIFGNVINNINDYYRKILGSRYILTEHSPINIMRNFAYIYLYDNKRDFYLLCKPENLES